MASKNGLFESELFVTPILKPCFKMVTPDIVKKAAHKLKSGRNDPSFSFLSDCLKNGPDNMYVCLSELIQGFLVHGHVTIGLLVSTLIPLDHTHCQVLTIVRTIEVSVCQVC